jgi:hypothetical protein
MNILARNDRRSFRARLREKGVEFCSKVSNILDQYVDVLELNNISSDSLRGASIAYCQSERFWAGQLSYNLRGPLPRLRRAPCFRLHRCVLSA